MKSRLSFCLSVCLSISALEDARAALNFEEVLRTVRTNLTDISEAQLSEAAALGLIQQLGSKVQLVTTNAPAELTVNNAVARTSVYSQNFGYFRIATVSPSLPADLDAAWLNLSKSNRLKGAILDLRYATGSDYESAGKTADLFVQNERSLIQSGDREIKSSATSNKIKTPVAVLVNNQTRGAAEALAAVLRETGAALLIGNNTAGEARIFQTFDLSTGQKLRIGTLPVEVGGKAIPAAGLSPDISVNISSLDERAYFQDPFLALPRGFAEGRGTNELASLPNRSRRFNEAELVRRHRDGFELGTLAEDAENGDGRQVIRDPALARAVDFLKGLAALRPAVSN